MRDNTNPRYAGTGPKPLVASMGSIAASGGYYVAMPAGKVLAESTTITGSIGVFAALPNVSELAHKNGVHLELIKAGSIKGGGSPFQTLSPEERQPWQEMVDHAYDRFLEVVANGRPGLTRQRLVSETIEKQIFTYDEKGVPIKGPDGKPVTVKAVRYRADGGSYTPPQAKELGLIDGLADLPTTIATAAEIAKLSKYRAVVYERPKGLAEQLLGVELHQPNHPLGVETLGHALTPRLWYLSPQFELAGSLSAVTTP
ncbi:S49 family peptidase [Fimbriiglobus ruber]|nr:S49 family peptidase [Fimbriiglobus ruber]